MLDLLLPPRCALCATTGSGLCRTCALALPAAPDLDPPPDLDACAALLDYAGRTPTLVAALKYRNHRDALPLLGDALAGLLEGLVTSAGGSVALTWAPTSAPRRRRRGYDQAELLARAVGRAVGLPCTGLLTRRPGPTQTGADRAHRLAGPTFVAGGAAGTVVVVDDVWTTGATLSAAATALRAAGARQVMGLTLAVRP